MTNKYTLITKTGKVLVFNVKAAAEIFFQAYGGVMIKGELCETTESEAS